MSDDALWGFCVGCLWVGFWWFLTLARRGSR